MNYAPQEGTQDAIDHYKELTDTINSLPKHNILLLIGDFKRRQKIIVNCFSTFPKNAKS